MAENSINFGSLQLGGGKNRLLGMYKTSFNKIYGYIFCGYSQKIGVSSNDCELNLDSFLLDPFTGLTGKCSSTNSVP